jgi:hypothetical protein
MNRARLLVCEKHGKWALLLHRYLAGELRIWETRSLLECWSELEHSPASLLLIELSASNIEAVVHRLAPLSRSHPAARVVLVGDPRLAACEMWLREAGAVHVHLARRHVEPIVGLVRRHFAHRPRRLGTLREALWERLPWPND